MSNKVSSTLDGPIKPHKIRRETRQNNIRKTALMLFSEQGYDRTTLKDIAEQLNLTHPALYYYYKTKADLLFDAVHSVFSDMVMELEQSIQGDDLDPITKFKIIIETQVISQFRTKDAVSLIDSVLYGAMNRADIFNEPQSRELMDLQRRMVQIYRDVLAEGAHAGLFKSDDDTLITFATIGAISNVPYWFKPDGKLSKKKVANQLASIFLCSLEK